MSTKETSNLSDRMLSRAHTLLREATLHRDVFTTSEQQLVANTVSNLLGERPVGVTSQRRRRSAAAKTAASADELESYLADINRNKEPTDSDFDTDLENDPGKIVSPNLPFPSVAERATG